MIYPTESELQQKDTNTKARYALVWLKQTPLINRNEQRHIRRLEKALFNEKVSLKENIDVSILINKIGENHATKLAYFSKGYVIEKKRNNWVVCDKDGYLYLVPKEFLSHE